MDIPRIPASLIPVIFVTMPLRVISRFCVDERIYNRAATCACVAGNSSNSSSSILAYYMQLKLSSYSSWRILGTAEIVCLREPALLFLLCWHLSCLTLHRRACGLHSFPDKLIRNEPLSDCIVQCPGSAIVQKLHCKASLTTTICANSFALVQGFLQVMAVDALGVT